MTFPFILLLAIKLEELALPLFEPSLTSVISLTLEVLIMIIEFSLSSTASLLPSLFYFLRLLDP